MAGAHGHADADLTQAPGPADAPSPADASAPGPRAGEAQVRVAAGAFQAVRLFSGPILGGLAGGGGPGGDLPPAMEGVRFVAADGFAHPDAEVLDAQRPADGGPVRLTVGFMGLTGPAGVLPDHYTETVLLRGRARDDAMRQFLDLFNHRAVSLFYRAWAKYRLTVRFAESGGDLSDPFSVALAALSGTPRASPDPRQLAAAGALARRVRTPSALRRALALRFDLPVEVQELNPRRIRIAAHEQTRLGVRGRFATLGVDAVAGDRVTDVAGRFRLRLGPLDGARFRAFFEPGGVRSELVEAVRLACGPAASFDLQLVLRARDVTPARLGGDDPARLGRTGWLVTGPAERDRDDAVLPGA